MNPTDEFCGGSVRLFNADCLAVLPHLPPVDAVVTDPPYELGFMGKAWDRSGVAFDPATWAAVLRMLAPGGYMLAFGGSRTYHRIACAVEDAGFEVRDCLMWLYGTGFPKGQGCLKPGYEPILLARKPGPKVLPLGIDGCRVPTGERPNIASKPKGGAFAGVFREGSSADGTTTLGRYPANVLHDGSDEVMGAFAAFGDRGNLNTYGGKRTNDRTKYGAYSGDAGEVPKAFDAPGTVARFFYCAKASPEDRGDNRHPTVKPLALMRWLCRLVTPPGGVVLDPFLGSGSSLVAAMREGFGGVGVERDAGYYATALKRLRHAAGEDAGQLFSVLEGGGA